MLRNATVFPRKGTAGNTTVLFRTVIRRKQEVLSNA